MAKRSNDPSPAQRRLLMVLGAVETGLKMAMLIDLRRRPAGGLRVRQAGPRVRARIPAAGRAGGHRNDGDEPADARDRRRASVHRLSPHHPGKSIAGAAQGVALVLASPCSSTPACPNVTLAIMRVPG